MARNTHNYFITTGSDDGYVVHDTSSYYNDSSGDIIYYNWYDEDGYCDIYHAFRSINIPKGSNIISATYRLNLYAVNDGWVEAKIKASTGNSIPTNYSEFMAMVGTDNYIYLHQDENAEEQMVQLDITDIIQEKVNEGTWIEGNNIILFTSDSNGETANSGIDVDSYEYNPITELIIVFEPPVTIDITKILTGNRIESFKYERLTLQNGMYTHYEWLNNIISGNININFTRDIIGTASFEMKDNTNINFLSDLIRPWYTLTYNDIEYSIPLGTYVLSSPNKVSNGKVVTRQVQGYDLLIALEQDKITSSVYYEAGENVIDTITSLLDGVGTWIKYSIPPSDEVLIEDMSYEIGKSKLFIINSLLNTINYYPLWCSGTGIFKSIPWSDNKYIAWNFEDNNESLYKNGIDITIDYTNMYNKVIIIARQLTVDTEPLTKTWTFEDENLSNHPLSQTSLGRYIVKIFDSEATSQSYVDLRARREILKMLEIEEAISYNHALITSRTNDGLPYQGDCYNFKNTLLNINAIYKIESFSYNLKVGELIKSVIRRVTNVE